MISLSLTDSRIGIASFRYFHNIATHIYSMENKLCLEEREIIFHCRVLLCFWYITTIWNFIIIIVLINKTFHFIGPYVLCIGALVHKFLKHQYLHNNNNECIYLVDMQQFQPKVNLWHVDIYFGLGGRMYSIPKSLMKILYVCILILSYRRFTPVAPSCCEVSTQTIVISAKE